MIELLQMYALVEGLGVICLPLTVTVFHNLPDRGWAFTKTIGVAVLAFFVWLPLMTIHILPFSRMFIAGVLLILLALNLVGFMRTRYTIVKLLRTNLFYILSAEVVFLGMVFLLGWLRSYGPDIRNFEMFMDEGFISAIMRSPNFPPHDVWFSGYALNYYYYAHFTIATLAKLLGQTPSIAFNTGICIFFGLTAVNLFGVTCNIVGWARHLRRGVGSVCRSGTQWSRHSERSGGTREPIAEQTASAHPSLLGAIPYGLMTIIMAQILGNLAATQQWFREHGDLSQFDWFAPSRVVDKTINEFPAFSFLLSCFHAHVLALAFTVVGVGLALNLFLEHDAKGLFIFGRGWRLPLTLGTTALVIGGLYAMNGWDLPTYLGIVLVCIVLQQWLAHQSRFSLELVLNIFIAGASLTALSLLLYAPFYLSYISPAQGIGIVDPADRSSLSQEVLIYGMFAFVFISFLCASALKWRPSSPAEGEAPVPTLLSTIRRYGLGVTIAVLVFVILIEFSAFGILRNSLTLVVAGSITVLGAASALYQLRDRPRAFALLLGTVAFALVAFCEVFFLKDVFAGNYPRMNTVFKFYFQAWVLLSIACGVGLYFIVKSFRPAATVARVQRWLQGSVGVLWAGVLLVILAAGAVYPIAGTYAHIQMDVQAYGDSQRTNSLDGLNYMQSYAPGDYAAIRWLNGHVSGDPVIVESIGPDYSDYGRISAFTGLPTPMGWIGHEYQWRVNWLNKDANATEFARRAGDIDSIYTNPDPAVVLSLLARYHAEYLYVGPLEQAKYPTANLQRFSSFMQVVYSADGVTIYEVQ